MVELVNFADIVLPSGKTIRQENLEKGHKFPVGALVEIQYNPDNCPDKEDRIRNGIRLHVVAQTRDCDGTPLYSLGIMGENKGDLAILKSLTWPLDLLEMFHGYSEESLILIKEPSQ